MLRKNASPNNWQKILTGLKKIRNIPQKTMGYINNPSMIEFEQSAENPKAVAYVTNEDYNNDGKSDSLKVHIVVPTFNTSFGTSDLASMAEDSPEFRGAIERIAKTLVHEVEGHVNDFNPSNAENPFAGGEAVADSAERAFSPVWASSTINEDNRVVKTSHLDSKGEYKVKKELVKLANHLDSIGHSDLADRLDSLISKAQDVSLDEETSSDDSIGVALESQQADLKADVDEDAAAEAQEAAEEHISESSDSQDRIDKFASLLSGEFSGTGKLVSR